MSRIGRLPLAIPNGVNVDVQGNTVKVKGPKGELRRTLHPRMSIAREDGKLVVKRQSEEKFDKALHGLSRTLVANMIEGVTKGFERTLEINGTGYRAQLQGKKLQLTLGYSHPVEVEPPSGIAWSPRLSVYRSLADNHAQLIDDDTQRTLAAASSLVLKGEKTKKSEAAAKVGELIAERAKAKGVDSVVLDRGGALYHGRVKAFADGARKAGLKF